jgi:uncharacterized OB-fold protein
MSLASIERDARSAEFFDAAATGVLLYQKCGNCSYAQLPIAPGTVGTRCRRCGKLEAAWTPSSGKATLVSWTSSPVRTADGTVPGPVIGLLELEEGPWLETQLRGLTGAESELAEGAAFHVAFERPEGSEPIPVFVAG